MNKFSYIIVGGGMAANAAIGGIRSADENGTIGVITAESSPPYDRPPLSKGLWQEDTEQADIIHDVSDRSAVTLITDVTIAEIKPADRQVVDDAGNIFGYEKLLLATGGKPKRLPFDHNGDILYYRTLADYQRLKQLTRKYGEFAIIGGGFIGSELAAALAMHGQRATLIFPDDGICARLFPADLAQYLNRYYRKNGVTVQNRTEVTALRGELGNFTLETRDGEEIQAEVVVAGIGIDPNVGLAEAAGLDMDGGVVVNAALRTSDPHIYAAGDIASFTDPVLGERRRVEHEDNAVSMGEAAGRAMAGQEVKYDHSPMFYSDLFDLGYEAVGKLDSSLTTVADWQEEFKTGVVYYLNNDKVRGVLLWNVWDKVDEARKLIAKNQHLQPEHLRGIIGDWTDHNETLHETFPASDPPATW